MKKTKSSKSAAKHSRRHASHHIKKSWILRYRWTVIGVMSLAALVLGTTSILLPQRNSVLGIAVGDSSGNGGVTCAKSVSYPCNSNNNHQVCKQITNSCSDGTKHTSKSCYYSDGKCGYIDLSKCVKFAPAQTTCGQNTTYYGNTCAKYASYYTVSIKKSLQNSCPNVCTGKLEAGSCGLPDNTQQNFEVNITLDPVKSCTKTKTGLYTFHVSGKVMSQDSSTRLYNSLDIDVWKTSRQNIITVTVTPGYSTSFQTNISLKQSAVTHATILGIDAQKIIALGEMDNNNIAQADMSHPQFIDLTKCATAK